MLIKTTAQSSQERCSLVGFLQNHGPCVCFALTLHIGGCNENIVLPYFKKSYIHMLYILNRLVFAVNCETLDSILVSPVL